MSRTIPAFKAMLDLMGSDVTYHKEQGYPCLCNSPEGFRDPLWHGEWAAGAPSLRTDALGPNQFLAGWHVTYYITPLDWPIGGQVVDFDVPSNGTTIYLEDFSAIDGRYGVGIWRQLTPPGGVPGPVVLINNYSGIAVSAPGYSWQDYAPLNSTGLTTTDPSYFVPVCNEEGMLTYVIEDITVKAAVQPATIGQRGRAAERIIQILGTVQRDDHYGIFPCESNGVSLNFYDFIDVESNFIVYDNRRFLVVAADKIPDVDGDPNHHWEVGLRLVKSTRPT